MIIKDNKIIDIEFNAELDADILECFLTNNETLLFPWFECNLQTYIPEGRIDGPNWNDFVLERTITKSKGDIFDWHLDENEHILWYSPKSREDLIRILEFNWLTYHCCVVPKGKSIKDYIYDLFMYEHYQYKGDEVRVLWIQENGIKQFETEIVPKVVHIIKKYTNWKSI